MSSHTVNFSQSAREYGLIIHSEGVEIMSPHYMAMCDGNDPAMPKDDLSGRPKEK